MVGRMLRIAKTDSRQTRSDAVVPGYFNTTGKSGLTVPTIHGHFNDVQFLMWVQLATAKSQPTENYILGRELYFTCADLL